MHFQMTLEGVSEAVALDGKVLQTWSELLLIPEFLSMCENTVYRDGYWWKGVGVVAEKEPVKRYPTT